MLIYIFTVTFCYRTIILLLTVRVRVRYQTTENKMVKFADSYIIILPSNVESRQ